MTREEVERRIHERWAAADDEVRAAIRRETFTGHNIPITGSESTRSGESELIGENRRTVVIKSLVRRWIGERAVSVLDLGALEGGLSFEMAREGWAATGVEAREENFRKAQLVASYYALPDLHFLQMDVKELSREAVGTFDVILCCGLLYHLDAPVAHLRALETLLNHDGMLFVDTHVAPDGYASPEPVRDASLSPLTRFSEDGHEYEGRWWSEPASGDLREQMWSAVSNARSMWLTRRSLIRALHHSGFHEVHDLYGMYEIDPELELRDRFSRVYIACRKRWE